MAAVVSGSIKIFEWEPPDGDGDIQTVYLLADSPGRAMYCSCGEDTDCVHKIAAINNNADGPFFLDLITTAPEQRLIVPITMSVRHEIVIKVKISMSSYVVGSMARASVVIMDDMLTTLDLVAPWPTVGTVREGEGRNAIRYMLMTALERAFHSYNEGVCMKQSRACVSTRHSMLEEEKFREAFTSPEKIWVWRYKTLVNKGTCPPCQARLNRTMSQYNGPFGADD